MRIVITGGLGFVGGRLTKYLSADHEVIISSRQQPERKELELHGGVGFIPHTELLSPLLFPKSVDTVIHLAALNEWDSVAYPSEAIRVNVDETRQILENSIAAGVKQFIYFSTAHVYGSPLVGTITESTLPVPQHPYSITHKAAEDYVIAATLQHKIGGLVIRLSNAFGAPVSAKVNRWTLLANDLCRQAIEKQVMTLKSNGCQYRDFICLTDVEMVVGKIIHRSATLKHHLYNLGSGKSLRVLDMAEKIAGICAELTGTQIKIKFPADALPSLEPELLFSIERLKADQLPVVNDVNKEMEGLVKFCTRHFTYHG